VRVNIKAISLRAASLIEAIIEDLRGLRYWVVMIPLAGVAIRHGSS
jgi:hypothetical protein